MNTPKREKMVEILIRTKQFTPLMSMGIMATIGEFIDKADNQALATVGEALIELSTHKL